MMNQSRLSTCREVRVFISSTFRDMHAERDHLVTVVFPELRERVEQLGLEFFDVDLRWGVPAKDANGETANSWEYCQQWIDRVEPFFICILGQRYGWVPEPEQLKIREDRQRQQAEPRSITDMEVRHAVLDTKLKRRSYFYLRATTAPATASEFVDPLPLLSKLEQLKNEVRASGRPVRDYPCEWTGGGFAGMEEFGRRVLDDLWSGVLREERYVSKDVWRKALGAEPDSDVRYTDESTPVPSELAEKLVALARPLPPAPLDAEKQQMENFAQARLRWFQGRTKELNLLTDFINSTDEKSPRFAAVVAVPGQGKSALLARLSTSISQPSTFLVTHFVGATERSASAFSLVQRLLDELDRSGVTWPAEQQQQGQEPKRDFNSLCLRLAHRLGDYAGERRIVILLDALNQLSDGHDLQWLPTRLGPSVRLIISCVDAAPLTPSASPVRPERAANGPGEGHTPEQRVLHALASRQPALLRVPLGPLTEHDVRTIVVAYLKEYCHELDREHLDTLSAITQARNPLYLLVMLNELRTLGGNDLNRIVPALIASMPQVHPDTVSLFRWVLQRLEVFGSEAVRCWCLYLAHGRVGMASHELADLLVRKLGADAAATALRIERGLRRYLQGRGRQLDFFHSQLRQAVFEQYGPQATTLELHREIASYFTTCAKGTDPQKEWETDGVRGFAECVFHIINAGQHDSAERLLSDFVFLFHKIRVGQFEGILEDYELLRREALPEVTKRLRIWEGFFREKAHILRRSNEAWPAQKILLQLAVENADPSPVTQAADRWLAEGRCDWLWLRRPCRPKQSASTPCIAVLEGHSSAVVGAMQTLDSRVLSWSEDSTLRLWDRSSGKSMATLSGHSGKVTGALLHDDLILSWSRDTTLRLWDSRSGAPLTLFQGHTGPVRRAFILGNGRIVSWSDNEVLLWGQDSGSPVADLRDPEVGGVLVLPDGRLVSWIGRYPPRDPSFDTAHGVIEGAGVGTTLRFWDPDSGQLTDTIDEEAFGVREWQTFGAFDLVSVNVQMLSDGRLVSWSFDTVRVWDPVLRRLLYSLKHDDEGVSEVLELPHLRRLVLRGSKRLSFWDSDSGARLGSFSPEHAGHLRGITAPSGNRVVSWSHGKVRSIGLWDAAEVKPVGYLDGSVEAIRVLSDGHQVISIREFGKGMDVWDLDTLNRCGSVGEQAVSTLGAAETARGEALSWHSDGTMRLWDLHACGAQHSTEPQEEHRRHTHGTLLTREGNLVSWGTPGVWIWDCESGQLIASGEEDGTVEGVLVLPDGRLVTWRGEEHGRVTVWDESLKVRLAAFEVDGWIGEVAILRDDRLVVQYNSRNCDASSKVCFDSDTGEMLEGDWEAADIIENAFSPPLVVVGVRAEGERTQAVVSWSPDEQPPSRVWWHSESDVVAQCLFPDGTFVVSFAAGGLGFLKLYRGNRRVTLKGEDLR